MKESRNENDRISLVNSFYLGSRGYHAKNNKNKNESILQNSHTYLSYSLVGFLLFGNERGYFKSNSE